MSIILAADGPRTSPWSVGATLRGVRRHALTSTYLSVLVAIPLLALGTHALRGGPGAWWSAVTQREALLAIGLTLGCALVATAINVVMGFLAAWVLVRDNFRGHALLNAVIDVPFALPTVVAGVTFMTLYGPMSPLHLSLAGTWIGISVALLFVTFPFCVRAVQPVLESLTWTAEQASESLGATPWQTLRHITFPALAPAIAAGAGLALARAVGEFGSVVFISGNRPFHTEVASAYIFMLSQSQNFDAAAGVSLALMLIALGLLILVRALAQRVSREQAS